MLLSASPTKAAALTSPVAGPVPPPPNKMDKLTQLKTLCDAQCPHVPPVSCMHTLQTIHDGIPDDLETLLAGGQRLCLFRLPLFQVPGQQLRDKGILLDLPIHTP